MCSVICESSNHLFLVARRAYYVSGPSPFFSGEPSPNTPSHPCTLAQIYPTFHASVYVPLRPGAGLSQRRFEAALDVAHHRNSQIWNLKERKLTAEATSRRTSDAIAIP